MVKLKICGITRPEDALFCASHGVDFLGFIFAKSPRQVSVSQVENLLSAIPYPLSPKTVGVFVDENSEVINQIVKRCKLDYVQLQGNESPEFCTKISVPVIKTFRIGKKIDLDVIKKYKTFAYLLDTYAERQAGGTGKAFDWDLALEVKKLGVPIFLSGGLNTQNIKSALEKIKPFAIDVSSGVESEPGIKDHKKIEEIRGFIQPPN